MEQHKTKVGAIFETCIRFYFRWKNKCTQIRYDTIEEFNVESKAEYSALSSTLSQKKKLKQTTPVSL